MARQANITDLCPAGHRIKDRMAFIGPEYLKDSIGHIITECRVMILVCEGSLSLSVSGNRYEMQAGSFLDMLDWAMVEITETGPGLKGYCLLVTYEFSSESLLGLKAGTENYFQERMSRPVMSISDKETEVLERQMLLIRSALEDQGNNYRKELLQTYFKSFILELGNITLQHEKEEDKPSSFISRNDMIITNFLKLIRNNFATEHGIAFYAGELNISTKHLSRIVKHMLGKTPHTVIRDELLSYASSLLTNDNLSIQEISELLHFSEQAAFCKFFKKYMNVSPMQYKRENIQKT